MQRIVGSHFVSVIDRLDEGNAAASGTRKERKGFARDRSCSRLSRSEANPGSEAASVAGTWHRLLDELGIQILRLPGAVMRAHQADLASGAVALPSVVAYIEAREPARAMMSKKPAHQVHVWILSPRPDTVG